MPRMNADGTGARLPITTVSPRAVDVGSEMLRAALPRVSKERAREIAAGMYIKMYNALITGDLKGLGKRQRAFLSDLALTRAGEWDNDWSVWAQSHYAMMKNLESLAARGFMEKITVPPANILESPRIVWRITRDGRAYCRSIELPAMDEQSDE